MTVTITTQGNPVNIAADSQTISVNVTSYDTSAAALTAAAATAADRVQTGLDRVQTGLDRVQTGLDRTAAAASAAAAAGAISGAPIYNSVLVTPDGSYTLQPPVNYDIALKTTGIGSVKFDAAYGMSMLAKGAVGPDYGPETVAISSGTYVSATGVITLTLAASIPDGAGAAVVLSGITGAGISPKLNRRYPTQAGTTGTTVVLQGVTGLGDGTFTGGNLLVYRFNSWAARKPIESMRGNTTVHRHGGTTFETEGASWIAQIMPEGVDIGSPNSLTLGPVNALSVGGGNPGNPNGFFGNVLIGQDWSRSYIVPDNYIGIQGGILIGTLTVPKRTSTATGTYNSTTGLVTLTLAADIGMAGYRHFTISGATGTGSFALLNGEHISVSGSATTITFYLATGLTMTITGMTVAGVPALRSSISGASWTSLAGAGGAQFVPTQPLEGHHTSSALPATSGTTSTAALRLKSDASSGVFDMGMAGSSGGYLVATGASNLATRLPIFVGDGGKVVVGGTTVGASVLRVTGLPVYADNTAALAGSLTAGDVYRTSTGVMMVVF